MTFNPKPVPVILANALRQKLRAKVESEVLATALGDTVRRRVHLSLPHSAYFLRLDDVAAGKSLAASYITATRVLLSDGERQVYSIAEVPTSATGLVVEAMSFEHGPILDQLLTDIVTLIGSPVTESASKRAELRLLRLPALQVVAVWVHWAGRSPGDWLLPTGPMPPCLTAQRLYDGASFLAALQGPAQQQLAASKRH